MLLTKPWNHLKNIHFQLIHLFLRQEDDKEDFIKVGFITTCLYTWFTQVFYCYRIHLNKTSLTCLVSFILNIIFLYAYKKNIIEKELMYHLISLVSILGVLISYIFAGAGVNPTMIWFAAIPVMTVTLLGIKAGAIWSLLSTLGSILIMTTFESLDLNYGEYSTLQTYDIGVTNLFNGPLLFFMMFGFYYHNRVKLLNNLEAEKKEKSKLLTILFHDLGRNTSLLSGYLELSENKVLSKKSKERVFELSEEIKNILQNAQQLDSEKVIIEKEKVYLVQLFKNIEKKFRDKLITKNIQLSYALDKEDYIWANKQQLKNHIIDNIIENAIKFSHRNSTIEITLNKDKSYLDIKDSGIGIENNKHLDLKIGTNQEVGTGNGIKIIKQFCEVNNLFFSLHKNIPQGVIARLSYKQDYKVTIK